MNTISKKELSGFIKNFKNKKVVVLGDLMLDRYFWGRVTRVSPEAPVPVVDIKSESYHLGGAANVASNLKSLGLETYLCGLVGDDEYGHKFVSLANQTGVNVDGVYIDTDRPTTVKTRVFGNNQQIVRLDTESIKTVSTNAERHILDILHEIKDIACIVFSDYNKGCLSEIVIREIITQAKNNNIPILVDPKFNNFFEYSNVTMVKPNKKEAEVALNMKLDSVDEINKAGKILLKKLNVDNVLLTLGHDGMVLFEQNGNITRIATKARTVADVSGAGDTAIASFAASYVGGVDVKQASFIANIASGIVCEKPGIVSIEIDELLKSFE